MGNQIKSGLIFVFSFFFLFSVLISSSHADSEEELFNTGVIQFKTGQLDEALVTFSELIDTYPSNAKAHKNRGVIYMKQKQYDLAIHDFEKAKSIAPDLTGIYSNLGVAYYYKKDYPASIENYDLEIEQNPSNHFALFNRGLCHAALENHGKAVQDMNRTLELKPGFYWALCYKGDLLIKLQRRFGARAAFLEAVKTEPEQPYAKIRLESVETGLKDLYFLQAGAFLNETNARKLRDELSSKQFQAGIFEKRVKDKLFYFIRVGEYADETTAASDREELQQKLGIKSIVKPARFIFE